MEKFGFEERLAALRKKNSLAKRKKLVDRCSNLFQSDAGDQLHHFVPKELNNHSVTRGVEVDGGARQPGPELTTGQPEATGRDSEQQLCCHLSLFLFASYFHSFDRSYYPECNR